MRRQFFPYVIGALSLAVLAFVSAQAADNAAIKEKTAACAGCHGENGISQTENVPSLAGQPDQFLQWQLVFFRAGSRKNDQMQPIVEEITNEDIRNFGAYFSQLAPPKAPEDEDPDLSKKGAQVAAGRRCASCHTDTYAGTKAVARLAGQREEYLVKALHDYKSGQRVGGGVAAMADVAYHMSEEEITAVAHYLAHLQ
ncbi:c-type cytochrome [Bradyrhizobium sp. 180]|uniref:c-type cytochrome n=1 Tax=unclassified Bradyrhizobium TaxID=2631580 RepID=UPI001FF90588|nr:MULTISPECIES: c-type cytochrome [unclassified Bradyrhizobium]MCK1423619.1 c-type cytochrome [Bradyrhizobium sp. CW12]MCK1494694.1 c-type cytochrome [Bradyrhizobium sp. 180]MCK1528258.1 c-type cytochrome [Bradyrhizobium sp. 182]MCK1595080.1 c-type cytochrome [Bradyrhizobium sp. 164]MCK1620930.1 c-type cytochrome [Bradyrhizobium sp. 159]